MSFPADATRQLFRRLIAAILASVAIAAIVALGDSTSAGRGLEERFGLRWLFFARGEIAPPAAVAIVAMNRHSAEQISLPRDPLRFHRCASLAIGQSPPGHETLPTLPARWPRCLHALLIERLTAAGSRVIAFDVLFRERRPLPVSGVSSDVLRDEDLLVAHAAKESGRVLIGQRLEPGPDGTLILSRVSPPLQHAVLGMAPFPLAVTGTDRYDRFNVIVDEGWASVTLAALSVLAYSLPAYDSFRELVARVDPDLAGHLPRELTQLRAGGHLQVTALMLRAAFRESPSLQERMLAELETARDLSVEHGDLIRAVVDTLSGPASRYTNFYGAPGRVLVLDYSAVLSMGPQELARHVADRAIVVGYLDEKVTEQTEHFPTPSTPSDQVGHSGAEILATAAANLIEGSDLRAASPLQRWGVYLVLAVIVCAAGFCVGASVATTAAIIIGALYVFAAQAAFQHARLWLPVVLPIAGTIPLSLAAGLIYRYQQTRRQRDRIRALFAKFVPAEFVETFERNAGNLVSSRESLDCACVATDAGHFTTLAEKMRPEDLAELLNRYFERLFGPVAHNGGLISDVVGDAMLALWPARDMRTRADACRALLQMRDASAEFSRTLGGGLSTRFGADFGPVSLGVVGGQEHYEYRAVGDPVNASNRLQELNKRVGTRILVSEALVSGQDEFMVRDLGPFVLRGKTRPVRVLELLAARADATPQMERLCAQFSLAANAIAASDISRARKLLQQIATEFPEDGTAPALLSALKRPGTVREGAILLD